MDAANIAQAVDLLAANRLQPGPFEGLPDACRPMDETEGYAIQSVLATRLAGAGLGPVAGVKIGCTTPVMQSYMKIASPCAGTIHQGRVYDREAKLRFSDYHRVGVECEIAVRLASALPDTSAPVAPGDLAPCVDACMAAIEIVDARYRDFRSVDTPTLIADDFFQAGCIVSTAVSDWHGIDLTTVTGRMAVNGKSMGTGLGGDILGHPFHALAWLAETGQAKARQLGAGSVVMLGSVVQTCWVSAGDRVSAEIAGLGAVQAVFA